MDLVKLVGESGIDLRSRIIYSVVATVIVIAILTAGAYTELNKKEANEILNTAMEILRGRLTPQGILLNNLAIALLMMVPVLGHGVAAYVIYQTGLVFSAVSVITDIPRAILLMLPMITFYGIVEMLAYGVALSEGTIIGIQAWKRRLRKEGKIIPLVILAVFLLLLIAALVEFLILFFTSGLVKSMGLDGLESII